MARFTHADALRAERDASLRSLWYFLGGERFANGQRTGLGLDLQPHVHGDFVEALEEGEFDEIMAMLARGMFKSTIGCGYGAWRLIRDRNDRGCLISSTYEVSEANISLMEQMLESEWIVDHFGTLRGPLDWSSQSFTVAGRTRMLREPSMYYKSLKSFKPGGHHNWVWIDDIEDQETVATIEQMAKTRNVMGLLYPMADEPDAKVLVTGTFWHDGDAYCHKEKTLGLLTPRIVGEKETLVRVNNTHRQFEFEGEDGSRRTMRVRYFYKPAINPDGSPLFPEKLSLAELTRIRTTTEMTSAQFNAQYLLDPVGGDDADFPARLFTDIYREHTDEEGHEQEPYAVFYGLDAAISRRIDGDYTAITGVKVYKCGIWQVFRATRHRINGKELIDEVMKIAALHPNALQVIEEDQYVAGLRQSFRDRFLAESVFPRIEWPKAGARDKKERRIRSYRYRFEEKAIRFSRGCELLEGELIRFPNADRRDLADALANVQEFATVSAVADQIDLKPNLIHPRIKKFLEGPRNWPYVHRSPAWNS